MLNLHNLQRLKRCRAAKQLQFKNVSKLEILLMLSVKRFELWSSSLS